MNKILVTGAGGFIGRSLVNFLSKDKNLIIAMDNNFRGSLKKLINLKM